MNAVSNFGNNIFLKNVLDNLGIKKKDVRGRLMIGVQSNPKNKIDLELIKIRVSDSEV